MSQQLSGELAAVAREHVLRQSQPCAALTGIGIHMRAAAIAVLIDQYLSGPPSGSEPVAANPAMASDIAIKITGPFPGANGRQVAGAQCGNQPLFNGVIRHP